MTVTQPLRTPATSASGTERLYAAANAVPKNANAVPSPAIFDSSFGVSPFSLMTLSTRSLSTL